MTARPALDSEELVLYLSLTWNLSSQRDVVEISPGFENLLSSLPLCRIVHFSASLFCRDDHMEGVEWLGVLPRLSRVEQVVLAGGYTYAFSNAFHEAHTMDVSPRDGIDSVVLPKLTSLTIKHAHFSFPLGDAELFSTLKRGLARRSELERTVPNITLISCHITAQQLAVLNTLTSEPIDCTGEPQTWGVGEPDDGLSDED
jgi:hypothetical protein